MMHLVPTGCNAHVGRPRCHPIPHPLRNCIPLENVPDFIAKIKFSPNLIVEVCPVYGGQKQVHFPVGCCYAGDEVSGDNADGLHVHYILLEQDARSVYPV